MQLNVGNVEEARDRSPHVVFFHLPDVSRKGNTVETKQVSGAEAENRSRTDLTQAQGSFVRGDAKCPKTRLW